MIVGWASLIGPLALYVDKAPHKEPVIGTSINGYLDTRANKQVDIETACPAEKRYLPETSLKSYLEGGDVSKFCKDGLSLQNSQLATEIMWWYILVGVIGLTVFWGVLDFLERRKPIKRRLDVGLP